MLLKDDDIQQVLLSKYFGSDQEKQEIVAIGLRDKKLLAALDELKAFISDLLATREAQMIEAVEKLPQRALCDDETKANTGYECAVYVPLGLVVSALRPQQQEEVSN